MQTIDILIKNHSFFSDLPEPIIKLISGCAQNKVFKRGQVIANEGSPAEYFYVIRQGIVAINLAVAGNTKKTLQTLGEGEICGWSWLFEPHQWYYEIAALEETHCIVFDGACLRQKCEQDHELGYLLLKRFSKLLIARLNATRLQLLDIYHAQSC